MAPIRRYAPLLAHTLLMALRRPQAGVRPGRWRLSEYHRHQTLLFFVRNHNVTERFITSGLCDDVCIIMQRRMNDFAFKRIHRF